MIGRPDKMKKTSLRSSGDVTNGLIYILSMRLAHIPFAMSSTEITRISSLFQIIMAKQ
jgi:hypothetical protein